MPHNIVAEFVQDVMGHRLFLRGSDVSRFVSLTLFKPRDSRHLVNFTCADFQVHSRFSISWSDNFSRVSQLHGAEIFQSFSKIPFSVVFNSQAHEILLFLQAHDIFQESGSPTGGDNGDATTVDRDGTGGVQRFGGSGQVAWVVLC